MDQKVSKVQFASVAIVTVFLSVIVLSDFVRDHPVKSHIDSSKSKIIGLTEKKAKKHLPLSVRVFLYTPPQIILQTLSPDNGNSYRNTFTPPDHLQSRAPPVFG